MDYEPITLWELAEPPKQLLSELYKKGIDVTDITTRGLATKVLDVLAHRDNLGLASPKQVNLLRKYKYVGVDSMTKDQAKKLITLTKNNKWRPLRKYQ
jgi:hypothetical protein